MSINLEVTQKEYETLLFGLNTFGIDVRKGLRKRKDDGLNKARETRLVELQELADKLQRQKNEH